jgi:phosphatidylinositol-3-phosphatase
MRKPLVVALVLAVSAAVAAAPAAAAPVPRLHHVFLIVGENTSFGQITPAHAPYLTGTIEPQAAWLTNYRSFTKSSSLGEYIAMVSGQYTKCEANNDLPDHCHQRIGNLFSQLDATGRTWVDWEESMVQPCDFVDSGMAWSKNIFSAHHNPAIYFTNVQGGVYDEAIAPKAECRTRNLPTGTTGPNDTSAMDATLAAGGASDFNLIVPNDCENGHDPCGTHDPVRQFDDFLAREVPKIQSSPGFGAGDVIAITWDEGGDPPQQPGHVLTALLGAPVKPGRYSGRYDHYSLARTLEDGFGVSHLAHARKAKSILGVWK